MILYLKRRIFTPESTIGDLYIDSKVFCHTLEDTVRDSVKIPKKTAIPTGLYELVVSFSQKFQREMPLLLNVPNFSGIRMHGGNTPDDTEGCILVAKNIINDYTIQGSMEKELTKLLKSKNEMLYIEISGNK